MACTAVARHGAAQNRQAAGQRHALAAHRRCGPAWAAACPSCGLMQTSSAPPFPCCRALPSRHSRPNSCNFAALGAPHPGNGAGQHLAVFRRIERFPAGDLAIVPAFQRRQAVAQSIHARKQAAAAVVHFLLGDRAGFQAFHSARMAASACCSLPGSTPESTIITPVARRALEPQ